MTATAARVSGTNTERITVRWGDVALESGYTIQWSAGAAFGTVAGTGTVGTNATQFVTPQLARQVWYVRVRANNALGSSGWSTVRQVTTAP